MLLSLREESWETEVCINVCVKRLREREITCECVGDVWLYAVHYRVCVCVSLCLYECVLGEK